MAKQATKDREAAKPVEKKAKTEAERLKQQRAQRREAQRSRLAQVLGRLASETPDAEALAAVLAEVVAWSRGMERPEAIAYTQVGLLMGWAADLMTELRPTDEEKAVGPDGPWQVPEGGVPPHRLPGNPQRGGNLGGGHHLVVGHRSVLVLEYSSWRFPHRQHAARG